MSAFSDFFAAMLSCFAEFLWSEPMRWIVGILLLLGIVTTIKKFIS